MCLNFVLPLHHVSDDPDGIYHHARKVLTRVSMEIRVFSYECNNALCFQNLLVQAISTIQDFVTSGRFTLAVYEWARGRGPPTEQLWLAEVDRSSFVQTSSSNPFIVSQSSPVGLLVTTAGMCEVENVDWANNLSAESMVSNLQNTTKTALYSNTGDNRIVPTGMVVEQSLEITILKICGQEVDSIQEPLQCSEDPSTFLFEIYTYLPYYSRTDTFSDVMEEQLNNIASFGDGAYPISSCSLSEAEVVSFAMYYPDWFRYKSCTNDGKRKYT